MQSLECLVSLLREKDVTRKGYQRKPVEAKLKWRFNMKMWLEEIGTAVLLFGLMYLVAVIMFSL